MQLETSCVNISIKISFPLLNLFLLMCRDRYNNNRIDRLSLKCTPHGDILYRRISMIGVGLVTAILEQMHDNL